MTGSGRLHTQVQSCARIQSSFTTHILIRQLHHVRCQIRPIAHEAAASIRRFHTATKTLWRVWQSLQADSGVVMDPTRQGKASFGDAGVFVEKYVQRARHIEVQIFGDGKGGVITLPERECSIQRRHQKARSCARIHPVSHMWFCAGQQQAGAAAADVQMEACPASYRLHATALIHLSACKCISCFVS